MIEVIYKEEKQEAKNGENLFNLPRNIRQVGLTTGNMRIYIEDYVYTFLTRLARNAVGSGKEQGCVAVFTGETKWNNGITYLFIRGALMVEDMEAASDHIDFSEKIWAKIQEDQAKYFPGQEITGWFFSRPQMYMETDELLTRIHLRYFGGEKVLMLMEPAEKEEAFFFFENGLMVRQRGYYIYYEKNPEMLHYMERENNRHVHIVEQEDDRVVRNIRGIMEEKEKFRTKKKQKEVHMGYGIAAVTALIVVFAFVVLMQNQSALNQVKQQLNTIQTMNRSHPANQDKTIVETQKAKLTPCPSTVPPTQENTSVPSVSPTPVPSAPAQNGVAQ